MVTAVLFPFALVMRVTNTLPDGSGTTPELAALAAFISWLYVWYRMRNSSGINTQKGEGSVR